jgi:hypothetical protein
MPKLLEVVRKMGLILATLVVVSPDVESHINVISITSEGAIEVALSNAMGLPDLRVKTNPSRRRRM